LILAEADAVLADPMMPPDRCIGFHSSFASQFRNSFAASSGTRNEYVSEFSRIITSESTSIAWHLLDLSR
jgi:hypothetical protein